MAVSQINLGNVVGPPGKDGQTGPAGQDGQDGHTPTAAEIRAAFNGETDTREIAADTTVSVSPNTMYSITATADELTVTFAPDTTETWSDGDFFFVVLSAQEDSSTTPATPRTVTPQFTGNIKRQGDNSPSSLLYIHGIRIGGYWAVAIN